MRSTSSLKKPNKTLSRTRTKFLPLRLYRVVGESMLPTLKPGEIVLGWRWRRAQIGDIVVVQVDRRHLIKRISSIDSSGIWLVGDNQAGSTDSRQFGAVSRNQIEAVASRR